MLTRASGIHYGYIRESLALWPLSATDGEGCTPIAIVCPNGHETVLLRHRVQQGGVVQPCVVCSDPGCDFHAHVTLVGWPRTV